MNDNHYHDNDEPSILNRILVKKIITEKHTHTHTHTHTQNTVLNLFFPFSFLLFKKNIFFLLLFFFIEPFTTGTQAAFHMSMWK